MKLLGILFAAGALATGAAALREASPSRTRPVPATSEPAEAPPPVEAPAPARAPAWRPATTPLPFGGVPSAPLAVNAPTVGEQDSEGDIPDVADKCPNDDGSEAFQDNDGCPDPPSKPNYAAIIF